jgi:hypothetical protein
MAEGDHARVPDRTLPHPRAPSCDTALVTNCPTGCGRTSPSGEMCSVCWARLEGDLSSVAELADDLDVALCRDVHFGSGGIGIVVRSAENPLPPNLAIGDVTRELRQLLGSWVRDLWESHAVRFRQCDVCGSSWFAGDMRHRDEDCPGVWVEVIDPLVVTDTLPELAGWLLRHPSWIKGHVAVAELYSEIASAVDAAWLSVDRPADRSFLGTCGAVVGDPDPVVCGLDLYAKPGRSVVSCRCGTEYDIAVRRGVLLEWAGDELLTAAEVSRALPGLLGRVVTAAQVRGYAHRGRLEQHRERESDVARYRVGDVAALMAELASEEPARVVA